MMNNSTIQTTGNSTEVLLSILNDVEEGVFSINAKTNEQLFISEGCTRIYGYTPQEFKDAPNLWFDIVHEEDKAYVDKQMARMYTGECVESEYRILRKDGKLRWLNFKVRSILDADGAIDRINGIITDITDKKKHEKIIEDTNAELNKIFDTVDEVLYSVDIRNGRVKHISRACERLYGYKPHEFYEDVNLWQKVILKEDEEVLKQHMAAVFGGKKDVRQYRIRTREGHLRWVENRVIPTLSATGELLKVDGITMDITAQKIAEEQLRGSTKEAEDYRTALIESAIVSIADKYGRIRYVNENFCKISKYAEHELLGQDHSIISSGVHSKTYVREFWKTITAGKIWRGEFCNKAKDGTLYWVDNTIVPFLNEDGEPYQYVSIRKDITQKKEQEERLRKSERQFREFFELAPEAIFIYDIDSKHFIDFNNNAELLLGYSAEELRHLGPADISPQFQPDGTASAPRSEKVIERVMTGERVIFEWNHLRKDGQEITCEVRLVKISDADQNLIRASIIDISEKKHNQQVIQKSEANFRAILDNTDTAYVLTDLDMNIVSFNQRAAINVPLHFNMPIEAGMSVYSFLRGKRSSAIKEYAARVLCGENISYDVNLKELYGCDMWYNMKLIGVCDNHGKVFGITIAMTDITIQKTISAELEKQVEERTTELRDTIKELESFSYTVSHDLMAPLRVMNGFAQILQEDYTEKLDAHGRKCIDVIMNNSTRMGQLINDLLDFSRLGRKPMVCKKVVMNELVLAVREELKAQAGAGFHAEIVQQNLGDVFADPAMLRQVWVNLLSNAIKYSSKKEKPLIEIGKFMQDGKAVYFVRDNGAGFSMAHADKLFGVFSRLHNQSEFNGTGVGLALVSRIITKHGGRIWADAKPGEGAVFYFTLN
ncbi:MAG: PAS domain S-box protein [Chitinophagales bacterium]